jgi:hypothetical protein
MQEVSRATPGAVAEMARERILSKPAIMSKYYGIIVTAFVK